MGFNPSSLQLEAVAAVVAPQGKRGADPIGEPLEEVRTRLLELTAALGRHLDEHAAPLLEAAQKQLRQSYCRIGIVGQVKAGKSTFINALVQQPRLLPTDINPCTAVVTLLNFRSAATPPEHAAVFTMFSADEWSELADGGGFLRELTQRLVPSFHPELLRVQLEFMRSRAERRLGSNFRKLLGQCHRFKEITPERLADYVSAGDDPDATGAGARPQFSDITRTAELFVRDGPFAFPTTLIDTPGTNDPFLVRDEITRRCLENPDMFVFVLSALQPLSPSDISMLRLLNGLHKDRIVVFINRLDQVADPATEGAAIKAAVEQRLRREFPALDIPVIIGSAWVGNLAHQILQSDPTGDLDPSLKSALEKLGLPAYAPAEGERARLAAALQKLSGMAEVSSTISRLMCAGGSAILFRQLAACLLELARSAEISARSELASIERLQAARRAETSALAARIAEEQQSLGQFQVRAQAIEATFRDIEEHLADIIHRGAGALRNDLQHIARGFSEEQAELMLHSLEHGRTSRSWACDVGPLRERLEETYLDAFQRMAGDITRVERFLYPQLEVIAGKLLPDAPDAFRAQPVAPLEPIPCEPLSARVALDLGAPWWKLWFAARPSPQERAQHLRQLIREEFYPVIDALVRLAETRLAERVRDAIARANALGDSMLAGIDKRKERLAAQYDLLSGGADKGAVRRLQDEQDRRAEALRDTKAACAACGEELAQLMELLDTAAVEPGAA
jgi:hypothetical protein